MHIHCCIERKVSHYFLKILLEAILPDLGFGLICISIGSIEVKVSHFSEILS